MCTNLEFFNKAKFTNVDNDAFTSITGRNQNIFFTLNKGAIMISNKKKKAFYIYFVRRQTLPISKVPVVKLQNVWEKFKNMPH